MSGKSFRDISHEKKLPVVAIDERGVFTHINHAFEETYGWRKSDLLGEIITKIIPSHMRDMHNFGFSQFLITETPRILGKPLPLPTLCKDGTVKDSEHLIVAEKQNGKWQFAAIIRPL